MGCVDVRDVAEAHFRAAFNPEAKGRLIISAENLSILELALMLKDKYGSKYPFPKKNLPKWMVWLLGPILSGITRQYVRDNVGYPWKADHTKSKEKLGMSYRPINKTMPAFFQQLIDNGAFKNKTR